MWGIRTGEGSVEAELAQRLLNARVGVYAVRRVARPVAVERGASIYFEFPPESAVVGGREVYP